MFLFNETGRRDEQVAETWTSPLYNQIEPWNKKVSSYPLIVNVVKEVRFALFLLFYHNTHFWFAYLILKK